MWFLAAADTGSGLCLWSGDKEFRQPGQIAGRHCHRELGADPVEAAVNTLSNAAHGLGPAKRFLDLLPAAL